MSSDDEELAELRAARAARTGGAGATLTALREQQRKAEEAEAARAAGVIAQPSAAGPRNSAGSASFGPPRPPAKQKTKEQEIELVPDDEEAMQDDMRQFFPMSFGDKPKKVDSKPMDDFHLKSKRPVGSFGPPRPPPRPSGTDAPQGQQGQAHIEGSGLGPPAGDGVPGADSDQEDDVDDVDPEEEDPYQLPISHEVILGSAHTKGVTCMELEHSGSRLITGSMDYTIRIYDFNGMKRDMKAFRELEPQEGHPVLSVSWSPTGDAFMVVTGSQQAKIYDRDGHSHGEFIRGDMYLRDKKNTKGHTSGLRGGVWHPTDRWTAMTCGDDGTLRIWDTHNILQKTVVKPSMNKPTSVTACAYGLDGRLIGAGLMDGSIQLWNVSGKFGSSAAVGQVLPPAPQMVEKQNWTYVSRSNQHIKTAHEATNEITSLTFSQDGHTMISRCMDSTLKVWDLRSLNQPLKTFEGLPCAYATTKAIFSPDEQLIVTGVSAGEKEEGGALVFIDKTKLEIVRKVGTPMAATAVAWHHRLNQIFIGTGNRKAGSTIALYNPEHSQRGVLLGAARAPRKPSPFDLTPEQIARAVYEAPLYRHQKLSGRKRREHDAMEAAKHHKPDPGMAAGMGKQGRIGTTSKTLLTQHLLKQRGALMAPEIELDPREAILRHEGKKDVFSHFTDAYKATQPKPIFMQEEEEEENEDE